MLRVKRSGIEKFCFLSSRLPVRPVGGCSNNILRLCNIFHCIILLLNFVIYLPFNTQIFNGKAFAQNILDSEVKPAAKDKNLRLDIIWIGDNPASEIYVNYKQKKAEECGIESVLHHLPSAIDQTSVETLVQDLNEDDSVTGFIIQLPIPAHLNQHELMAQIAPWKDVDGLSPFNLGKLWHYQDVVAAATPVGIMRILKDAANLNLEGKDVVVINDSDIVGKPLGAMLLREHSTVTFCTKYTKDLSAFTQNADIIITATGVPDLIHFENIKEGAVLIDVGIKRVEGKIFGDVDFDSCNGKASFLTPVPGGVGPVTVAMLLRNLVELTGVSS